MAADLPVQAPAGPSRLNLAIVLLAAGGLIVALIAFQLRAGQVAVVTTFGRVDRALTEPGLYAKWPWPVQAVRRFDGRLQVLTTELDVQPTADGVGLYLAWSAAWQIDEPAAFVAGAGDEAGAAAHLAEVVRTAAGHAIGRRKLSALLQSGDDGLAAVEQAVARAVTTELADQGFAVRWLGLTRLALPELLTRAMLARMRREREAEAERTRAEGEAEAAAVVAEAEARAGRTEADADAKARRIQAEADRQAAPSYRVLAQEPELAELLFDAEVLDQVIDEQTTLLLRPEGPGLELLAPEPAAP